MTGQDIVDDVRAEIIEPSPTFFSNSRILALINQAQDDYVRRTRVLQSFAFTSTIQGQSAYPLPADWLGSEKVFYNLPNTGIPNWRALHSTNIEKMGQESPNFLSTNSTTQGMPQKSYVIGKTLYIFPTPLISGINDLFLFYESKATKLLTLNDLLSIDDSLYPGVRAYVLSKLWKQDNEDAKAKEEMSGDPRNPGRYENEIGEGRKWKKKRVLDERRKIDIESYVPFSYSGYNSGSVAGQINPLNQ